MTSAIRIRHSTIAATSLATACLAATGTMAAPALVIDVDTGRVIHAEQATNPWYPASVTKLMTAYVVLSEIKAGRVTLDTPLRVTARAATMAPSKIGFKPGTEVTVDNALKIIMVKSANDVAVTLAEGMGGSVEGFAGMMNAAAQRLGMHESNFVNPNGLPDEGNRTSARDLAILGRALLTEFSDYSGYFGIGAIQYGKRVMKNTNGLIGRYPGADGMKTGFICASGFNVVATASRNGRRLLVVVLGSYSATERTIKAASLFDKGFSDFGWSTGGSLASLPASFATAPPDMRPEVCGGRRGTVSEEETEVGPPVNASAGGNAENLAFDFLAPPAAAASSVRAPGTRTKLGPRASFVPVMVFAGRAPGSVQAPEDKPVARAKARAVAAKPVGKVKPATVAKPARAAVSVPAEALPGVPSSAAIPGKPAPRPGAAAAIRPVAAGSTPAASSGARPGAIVAKPQPAKPAAKPATPAADKPE